MSWKPTEGMKQADLIVGALATDAAAAGCPFNAVFCYRAQHVIAQALDEALAQGGGTPGRSTRWSEEEIEAEDAAAMATENAVVPLHAALAATKAEKAPRKRKGARKAKRRGNAAKTENAAAAPSEGA